MECLLDPEQKDTVIDCPLTALTRLLRTAVQRPSPRSEGSCPSQKTLVYLMVPVDTVKCLWSRWLPFSGFLNSPEEAGGGDRNGYTTQHGDAADLPWQNFIFCFVPSSSSSHSQNLHPFLAPY